MVCPGRWIDLISHRILFSMWQIWKWERYFCNSFYPHHHLTSWRNITLVAAGKLGQKAFQIYLLMISSEIQIHW